jgi:hypothetical protein
MTEAPPFANHISTIKAEWKAINAQEREQLIQEFGGPDEDFQPA